MTPSSSLPCAHTLWMPPNAVYPPQSLPLFLPWLFGPSPALCCLHAAKIRLHALSSSFLHLRRLFRSHEESILALVAPPMERASEGSFSFPPPLMLSFHGSFSFPLRSSFAHFTVPILTNAAVKRLRQRHSLPSEFSTRKILHLFERR